jgi:arsenate reductase
MTDTELKTPLHGLTSDEEVLHRVVAKLADRFEGIFAAETVDRYVFESYTALARTSKVRGFLVPRTERFAADRLRALATAKGALVQTVPEVLFICVQNSGRSQMAAALLKDRAGDRVHVRSAGSAPAEQIDPHAIEVMRRRGVSLDEEFPSPSPTTSSAPPTSSSPWAAETPAPSTRASGTSTGPSPTRPARPSRSPRASPSTSRHASTPSWPN